MAVGVNCSVFPERDEAAACGWFYLVSPDFFGLQLLLLLGNGKPLHRTFGKRLIVTDDPEQRLARLFIRHSLGDRADFLSSVAPILRVI
jgi:hypothetical protein